MLTEYLTLAAYFVLLLVIGGIFARFNRNVSAFVRGGARGTWWMVGTSTLMAGISAFTFTGNGAAAFEAGPTMLVIYAANVLGFVVGGLGLAAWFRQTRAYTYGDIVKARFGPAVERTYIGFNVLFGPFSAAVQLWALSLFVGSAFGLPLTTTIIVVGVITLLYSTSGGMWGVMATDVLQGILMYGMTILIAVLSLVHIGGLGAFWTHYQDPSLGEAFQFVKPTGAFPQDRFTWQWIFVAFGMQLLAQLHLASGGRYLAAKDGREAVRSAWLGAIMMAFGSIVWFIPPMVARFLHAPEVLASGLSDPATAAYAVTARHVLPQGMLGLLIAAMFAATMSSIDSGLNVQTGVIVNNMLLPWRAARGRPAWSDRTSLAVCRLISLGFGGLIIAIAIFLSRQGQVQLFDMFMFVGSIITVPIMLPLMAGVVLRRMPAWCYFTLFVGGLLPSLYTLLDERWRGTAWTLQERSTWVVAGAVAALLLSWPFRHRRSQEDREREDQFQALAQTPVDFAAEIGEEVDDAQARIMARIIYVTGLLMLLLLLVPNPLSGRLAILGLALFVMACGWGLRRCARKPDARATAPALAAKAEEVDA